MHMHVRMLLTYVNVPWLWGAWRGLAKVECAFEFAPAMRGMRAACAQHTARTTTTMPMLAFVLVLLT